MKDYIAEDTSCSCTELDCNWEGCGGDLIQDDEGELCCPSCGSIYIEA